MCYAHPLALADATARLPQSRLRRAPRARSAARTLSGRPAAVPLIVLARAVVVRRHGVPAAALAGQELVLVNGLGQAAKADARAGAAAACDRSRCTGTWPRSRRTRTAHASCTCAARARCRTRCACSAAASFPACTRRVPPSPPGCAVSGRARASDAIRRAQSLLLEVGEAFREVAEIKAAAGRPWGKVVRAGEVARDAVRTAHAWPPAHDAGQPCLPA